jgi:hypothetical protein
VFAVFAKTALIPFVVNYSTNNWFVRSGLVSDVFFNTLAIWFVSPLIYLYSPYRFYSWFIRYLETRKGKNSLMTQKQLNQLYKGPALDMPERYSESMILVMISSFYAVLIPIVPMICLLGAMYQYSINTWMLLRVAKTPIQMGNTMNTNFARMFLLVIILYSLGQFIFLDRLSHGEHIMSRIVMWIYLVYLLAPFKSFEDFMVKYINMSDEITYESYAKNFIFDYKKSNPV